MEANIYRSVFKRKRKRFLVQTGNEVLTADFIRDGVTNRETNLVPVFNN